MNRFPLALSLSGLILAALLFTGCTGSVPAVVPTAAPTSTPVLDCGGCRPDIPTIPTQPAETATPEVSSTPSSTIDITSGDYDAALARWLAADVQDYRMEVTFVDYNGELSGKWTFLVEDKKIVEIHRGGTKVYIDDGRSIPNPEANPGSLNFLTIDGQFARIRQLLDDPSTRGITVSGDHYDVDYLVKFNDALGYPETFGSYPQNITDSEQIIRVTSLEVLKQGPNASVTVAPTLKSTPTSEPDPTETPGSLSLVIIEKGNPNSQRAYDEALAKWQTSGIAEYEVTSHIYAEGTEQVWTLRVKGSDVTVIYSTEGQDATPDDTAPLTVDAQFASMADILAGNDFSGIEIDGQKYYLTYGVIFDPQYGYPTRFDLDVRPGPVMDAGYVIEVEDFDILGVVHTP
ncbi:MAG: DUF6174 domain-containing protein [Chloroflexota bacterium]